MVLRRHQPLAKGSRSGILATLYTNWTSITLPSLLRILYKSRILLKIRFHQCNRWTTSYWKRTWWFCMSIFICFWNFSSCTLYCPGTSLGSPLKEDMLFRCTSLTLPTAAVWCRALGRRSRTNIQGLPELWAAETHRLRADIFWNTAMLIRWSGSKRYKLVRRV